MPEPRFPRPPRARGVYCNRTLNLRSIRAIGYDMDYTLIHYKVDAWERRAYEYLQGKLVERGWPVGDLTFDPTLVMRGLILDRQLGNLLKANRFGYVKRAAHGTQLLDFESQRRAYARVIVDLNEPRWVFLNTLFSLSEASMYAQLVDLLDARALPGVMGYADLYTTVRAAIDEAHVEGLLKSDIINAPERYVEPDPDAALTLLDQRRAGKRLLLITNSEWEYTAPMMAWAFDRFLPTGTTWRDLFDCVIVSARKPGFFEASSPLFEVVEPSGLLQPARTLAPGKVFLGGDAAQVERFLGVDGDQILYVGDHIYADVHVSKDVLRWRTALVLREIEDDLAADAAFEERRLRLQSLMARKEDLEFGLSQLRLAAQRAKGKYGPQAADGAKPLERQVDALRKELVALDEAIAPLAAAASELSNARWGPLMLAGNDKSHLARQLERYADVYMSRVSNLLYQTPFGYLRAPRGTLPHDTDRWVGPGDES